MIESKDDARLHRDAVRMKTPDDFAVLGGVVVAFVGHVETGLGDCFQAEEQGFASAARCEGRVGGCAPRAIFSFIYLSPASL